MGHIMQFGDDTVKVFEVYVSFVSGGVNINVEEVGD